MLKHFADCHCDTAVKAYKMNESLKSNRFHVSFDKLYESDFSTQVFAIFNDGSLFENQLFDIIDFVKNESDKNKDFVNFITNQKVKKRNVSEILCSIEALGNTPDLSVETIDRLYLSGVFIISLSWNNSNKLCGGCYDKDIGFSTFGKEILKRMEKYNMILDLSHISERGFFEALDIYPSKVCCTHSNSYFVCQNRRNLTDLQFLELVKRNGICGINFYPEFVNAGKNATIDDVIRHIEHFISIGGQDNISLGSDFDGIDETVDEIADCSKVYRMFERMAKMGFDYSLIKKIAYENFERFINF